MESAPGITITTFLLLPDRREPEGSIEKLNRLLLESGRRPADRFRLLPQVEEWGGSWVPTEAWGMVVRALDPDALLRMMRDVDWHHPPMLVWRGRTEDRWSFARIAGYDGEEQVNAA